MLSRNLNAQIISCNIYIIVLNISDCYILINSRGPVVRRVDSAIHRIVILSSVVKMLENL